jgi:transcriptional regulator with XRE-family HTH domain
MDELPLLLGEHSRTGALKGMQQMQRRIGIAARVRQIRQDFYGEDGLEKLAGALGVPEQTWRNYERGVTMPAELLLAFIALTGADPNWLLTGDGERMSSQNVRSRLRTVRQSDVMEHN